MSRVWRVGWRLVVGYLIAVMAMNLAGSWLGVWAGAIVEWTGVIWLIWWLVRAWQGKTLLGDLPPGEAKRPPAWMQNVGHARSDE